MSRYRTKNKKKNMAAYFVGSLLIAIVFIAVVSLLYLGHSQVKAVCREKPNSVVEIVIDVSDPLPEVTQSQIRQQVSFEITENSFKGALVELRILNPNESSGKLVFSHCHPGNGNDVSELNGDPERARKIWQDSFFVPFSDALSNALKDPNSADTSPLLETLQAITVNEFISRSDQKKLIVVSDMLQHSTVVSFYKNSIRTYDDLSTQPIWPKVKPVLAGASVDYFVLGRQSSKVITSDLKHFWCISWEAAAKNESPLLGDNCPGWHDLVGLGN